MRAARREEDSLSPAALSKLAASSEFTIMRVSGMSTVRLAAWVAKTGLLLVAATYLLSEVIAPALAGRMTPRAAADAIQLEIATAWRARQA